MHFHLSDCVQHFFSFVILCTINFIVQGTSVVALLNTCFLPVKSRVMFVSTCDNFFEFCAQINAQLKRFDSSLFTASFFFFFFVVVVVFVLFVESSVRIKTLKSKQHWLGISCISVWLQRTFIVLMCCISKRFFNL